MVLRNKLNVYYSFNEIPRDDKTALTVGTFDGVHRGHRIILDRLMEIGRNKGLRPVMLTLDPHPQIVLSKSEKPKIKLLTTIDERLWLLSKTGLEHVLIIPFNYEFSRTSPEDFVRNYLVGKVGMSEMLIGYDHMFGKNRGGNVDLLSNLSKELGFGIEQTGPHQEEETIVSSTVIRKLLSDSQLEKANEYLGYDYFLFGRVVAGDGRGRQLGVPTANIQPQNPHKMMPSNGVYFVSAIIDCKRIFGMANMGTRPTFTDKLNAVLEVNFFEFEKDIYGKRLQLDFHSYIRAEQKFSGKEEFLAQLDKDRKKCMNLSKSFYSK